MNNEIGRKLTSLTLIAIMVAGGLTFAIPAIPVAAQSSTLIVSASGVGSFGGPQIIEIQVDDDSVSDRSVERTLDVQIDDNSVLMTQADTGKWYAYIADESAVTAANEAGPLDFGFELDQSTLVNTEAFDRAPDTVLYDSPSFLESIPTIRNHTDVPLHGQVFAEADRGNWPFIQLYEFDDGDSIDITYEDEVVTLEYVEEFDGETQLNLDRTEVPLGGIIHIELTDPQLNLDPRTSETWYLLADGSTAYYGSIDNEISNTYFDGDNAQLTVENLDAVAFSSPSTDDGLPDNAIKFTESGRNTGIFESWDGDITNLELKGNASVNAKFDIDYAGETEVEISVLDDDSTIELSDIGEWNTGEIIDITVSDPNRDLNTRTDDDFTIGSGPVPTIIMGDPETLDTLTTLNVDSETLVGTLDGSGTVTVTAALSADRHTQLTGAGSMHHFINYHLPEGVELTVGSGVFNVPDALTGSGLISVNLDAASRTSTLTFTDVGDDKSVVFDLFTFGERNDNGIITFENNAVYRQLLTESDTSGTFEGKLEYTMINQLTQDDSSTYAEIASISDELKMVVADSATARIVYDESSVDQDINTYDGELSLDATSYSINSDVTVTLTDADLDEDRYTNVDGTNYIGVGNASLLEVEIGGKPWPVTDSEACTAPDEDFRLDQDDNGTYTASFEVPRSYCSGDPGSTVVSPTTGESLKITYTDFRTADGSETTITATATIQAQTGSVSLDRTSYPLPFDIRDDRRLVSAHPVIAYVQVTDPDLNLSPSAVDSISGDSGAGPVQILAGNTLLFTAGGDGSGDDLGALTETDPDTGIFEIEVPIDASYVNDGRIRSGTTLNVQYTDASDASGRQKVSSDSAVFRLGNAVLQTDKREYAIGETAFVTLIDNDRNLDSDTRELIPLTEIEWLGDEDGTLILSSFEADPAENLKETEPNSGIFQVEITIPRELDDDNAVNRGERIVLAYVDESPAGSAFVFDDSRDVETTISISQADTSISLDKSIYSWRDKMIITVFAPDFNFDSESIESIGDDTDNNGVVGISTRDGELENYRLDETGPNTGIFTGEVTLKGFARHPVDGGGETLSDVTNSGTGPDDGTLPVGDSIGISVYFEYEGGDVVTSASTRWNVAEVIWVEDAYRQDGIGIVQVIDADRNLYPEIVDSMELLVISDTFRGGIYVPATETARDSGIFQAEVNFSPGRSSSGSIQVAIGDTVTAIYTDTTLPPPDDGADLDITGATSIGATISPLERVQVSNPAVVDSLGNPLDSVSVDQQISISADLGLNDRLNRNQDYAFLLQIQDENGVTVQLSWVAATLTSSGASASQSWTPEASGDYTASIFVWESIANPTALSPQQTIDISVQ